MRQTNAGVERLRPEGLRSRPVRIENVFGDPDAVLDLVRDCAPYKSMLAYHSHVAGDDALESTWFIDMPRSDMLVQNPRLIAAAQEAFSAEIVRPLHCTINVYGPAEASTPHMDLPVFGGMSAPKAPIWLLMAMSFSGLFFPWLVPVASGLTWFHRGTGGDFEYWPDGPSHPSVRVEPPMWNFGVMSDNEVMWHRVGAIGNLDQIASLAGRLKTAASMELNGGKWEVHDYGERLCAIDPEELRVSLLWKAYVFGSEDHLKSFENEAYGLSHEQVVDIFGEDLARRGIDAPAPRDPLHDDHWRRLIQDVYRSPFQVTNQAGHPLP